MEAKVDVRKLQLLNDRINQTIDALNEVRLSVRGLSHTGLTGQGIPGHPLAGMAGPQVGFAGYPAPHPFTPLGASPLGASPWSWGAWQGLQHSSPAGFGLTGQHPLQATWAAQPYLTPDLIERQLAELRATFPYAFAQSM